MKSAKELIEEVEANPHLTDKFRSDLLEFLQSVSKKERNRKKKQNSEDIDWDKLCQKCSDPCESPLDRCKYRKR